MKTELGVHLTDPGCAPTARANGTVSWRMLGRVMAPSPAVSQAAPVCHCAHVSVGVPCCSLLARDTKIVSRHSAHVSRSPRALLCVSQRPYVVSQGAVAPYRSLAALHRDPKVARSATTQNFVSRPSASKAMRARAVSRPCARASRIMACLGRIVAHAQP